MAENAEWILSGGELEGNIVSELPTGYVDDGWQNEIGSGDDKGYRLGVWRG